MKKIIFKKINLLQAIENGLQFAFIPAFQEDMDVLIKHNDFMADIVKYRNIQHFRKFMKILRLAIEYNIFEKMINSTDFFCAEDHLISDEYINSIMLEKKDNVDCLLYILKWLFLPLVKKVYPNGITSLEVGSISFSDKETDQIEFQKFYNKCLDYISFKTGIKREVYERRSF